MSVRGIYGESFISPQSFSAFTYPKKSHFELFKLHHYDTELFGGEVTGKTDLKHWTDLMVFAFIRQNIPPGSRILDVGGGKSRILKFFQNHYEGWNIDKLEGLGHGPLQIQGYRLIQDYIGNFNPGLPDAYFDFVFSISALEHTPADPALFPNIFADLQRVLKPGGYSLHCFDILIKNDHVWTNPLLRYLFEHVNALNPFISFETMRHDPDLYTLSEEMFQKHWERFIKKPYHQFGKPTSYNILWQKEG